jgi:hypothetical protein
MMGHFDSKIWGSTFWSTLWRAWMIYLVIVIITTYLNTIINNGGPINMSWNELLGAFGFMAVFAFWIAWGVCFELRAKQPIKRYWLWLAPVVSSPILMLVLTIALVVLDRVDQTHLGIAIICAVLGPLTALFGIPLGLGFVKIRRRNN